MQRKMLRLGFSVFLCFCLSPESSASSCLQLRNGSVGYNLLAIKPSVTSGGAATGWCHGCTSWNRKVQSCYSSFVFLQPIAGCVAYCVNAAAAALSASNSAIPTLVPKFKDFYPKYTDDSDVYLALKKKSKEIGSCEKQANTSIGSDSGAYTHYIPTCRTTMPDIRKSQVKIQNFMSKSALQSNFNQNSSQLKVYLQNTKSLMASFTSYLSQWNSSYTVCLAYNRKKVCKGWNALGVCWKGYKHVNTSCKTYSAPIYPNRTAAFSAAARASLVSTMLSKRLADANFKLIQSAPGFIVQENSVIAYVKNVDLAALNRNPQWLTTDSVKFSPPVSLCAGKGTPVGVTMGMAYSYTFTLNWLQTASLSGSIGSGGKPVKNIQAVVGVACAPMRSFYFARDTQ